MQNINWSGVFIAMVVGGVIAQFSIALAKWSRKKGYVREPIGKYGWGFVKGDFSLHWMPITIVCVVLALIFYFIYLYSVQFA